MPIVEMKVPIIGESVTEVTLSQWLVAEGDIVEIDQSICEFESDKATLEFPAEAAGRISFKANEDDDLEIGALVATIDTDAAGSAPAAAAPAAKVEAPAAAPAPAEAPAKTETYATGHASPAAAKILSEKGVDASAVAGSGRDGRITKEDAMSASAAPAAKAPAASPAPAAPKASAPSGTKSREERREKMSRMRRTIAKRLVSAKNNTAMLTTFNEVDLSNLMALRKQYQEKFVERYGVKLGFMSLFSKACATVLMEMPDVNAFIDGDHLIYHDYADISVAVSTPTGLVVPPIHNVESMNFAEIELAIKAVAKKARDGSLTMDEMTGGTFTITNGGVFGSMLSTPILNEPQSAILGMHNIIQRPVAVNGEVVIRPMMYLALSYDHRVIDGSSAVTFLVKVKNLLEDPTAMLLGI
ncbi:MAG: 2-oxoglutarate dehydrogenase complex dihydrolipoyllysine-residue succinyltransferase [Saprospiraceae bacterium]